MRRGVFCWCLWAVLLFAACAGTPPPVLAPAWARSLEAVYPRAAYIAQRGEGATRQEAELAALNAVSFYFESEITAEESGRRSWSERDGIATTESRTETATLVRSQTRLTAVRYAEDAWFNPAAGVWETAAFIDRAEAWAVYEPQAVRIRDGFLKLAAAAEAEDAPFSRALRFGAAAVYAEGAEFAAVRGFAQILHPNRARPLFAEADAVRAALPEKIYSARQRATVFIDCPADFDGMVYRAALAAFGAAGFPVERNRSVASAVCLIRVDEGAQKLDSGTFFNPSLTGTITGGAGGGAVFSFSATAPRQGTINPEVGRRRAYTALAAALGDAFSGEINRAYGYE
jgi:hypothetical protein